MPIDFQGKELQYVRELQHRVEKANSLAEGWRRNWERALEIAGQRGLEIRNLMDELDSALDEVGRLENKLRGVRAENSRLEHAQGQLLSSRNDIASDAITALKRYEAEKIAHEKTKQQLAELKNHIMTQVLEGLDNGKIKFTSMDLSVQAYY